MFTKFAACSVLFVVAAFAVAAAADYEGSDGYGPSGTTYEYEVSHDGYYPREGQTSPTRAPTDYVVVESEEGTTEQIDGETVIVVHASGSLFGSPSAAALSDAATIWMKRCSSVGAS